MNEGRFFSGKPTPVGEVLREYLDKAGLSPKIRAYGSLGCFAEWFPELSSFCRPMKFERGSLYLAVDDPLYVRDVRSKIPAIRERFHRAGLPVERVKIQCR